MLESIGALTLIAIAIFLSISYTNNKENENRLKQESIKHSLTAQLFIRKYEESVNKDKPIMTEKEFNKTLNEILSDKNVKEEIRKRIEHKKQIKKEVEQRNRTYRKIGYKYEENIFTIFYDNRELSKELILNGIKTQLNLTDLNDVEEIFNIWLKNYLISNCAWNEKMYEIGDVLKHEHYKIDDEDLTREDWLKRNNIELKPNSKEFTKYIDYFNV